MDGTRGTLHKTFRRIATYAATRRCRFLRAIIMAIGLRRPVVGIHMHITQPQESTNVIHWAVRVVGRMPTDQTNAVVERGGTMKSTRVGVWGENLENGLSRPLAFKLRS